MSFAIKSRTISAALDKRITLLGDECVRTLTIGSSWSTLRLGIRLSINDFNSLGAINLISPSLFIGLCSGSSAAFGASSTTNALGIRTAGNLIYHAGSPAVWGADSSPPTMYPCKRVATTLTTGGTAYSTAIKLSQDPATSRQALVLEIVKGSPNFTLEYACNNTDGTDLAIATLLTAMEGAAMSNVVTALGAKYARTTPMNFAFDEGAGSLDSINIFWGSTIATLEISDVLFVKVA